MTRISRTLAFLFVLSSLLAPQATQAGIIAGFENWASSGGLPDFPATFTNTATATYDSTNGSINTSAASLDGTFGSFAGVAADATNENNNDGSRLTNGANHTYTFTFNDTSGANTDLDSFHFDLGTFRPNSARTWTLSILGGSSITPTTSFATGMIAAGTGGVIDFFDIDVDLTSLADSTLDANGTAIFELELSGGVATSGHHGFLDNVAVSFIPVPEPQGVLMMLSALAMMGMIPRRR